MILVLIQKIKKIPVSKTATVGDYQQAGKRPHLSIIQSIIQAKKLEPTVTFNIRRGMIVEKVWKAECYLLCYNN